MKAFPLAVRISTMTLCGALACAASAQAQVAVTSPILVEHEAIPGETYQGTIKLKNMSAVVHRVRIYQTDYLFSADGSNAFNAPGTDVRSNARWITISASEGVVLGNQESSIDYSITVPSDPKPSGSYWSVVMVEQEPEPAAESAAGSPPAMTLTPTIRYGIQLATHLASTDQPRVEFSQPVVNGKKLTFDISNPGDSGVRPNVRFELYSGDGVLIVAADSERGLLYPATSVRQTVDLPEELTAGAYTAVLLADVGLKQLIGARFQITKQ